MIVAIGNPVYDLIQTPMVDTGERVLSGCSTNACLVLRKLGYPACCLVGNIGPDFRDTFVRDVRRFGVGFDVRLSAETGGFRLIYDEAGDRTLDVLGVAGEVEHLPARWDDVRFVLFGPILGEVDLPLIQRAREATDAPFLLDPQGLLRERRPDGRVVRRPHRQMDAIVPLFQVVKANEHEAQVMTGIHPREDPHGAARAIYRMGCLVAIVTLAEAGSVVYDGETFYDIPAYRTVARDPTGAGDSYAGAFIYRYLETGGQADLREMACFASAVASVMVEHTGPDFPLTPEEAGRRTGVLLDEEH